MNWWLTFAVILLAYPAYVVAEVLLCGLLAALEPVLDWWLGSDYGFLLVAGVLTCVGVPVLLHGLGVL